MKKALIIIPNLLIMGFILFFIVLYANNRTMENRQNEIDAFEKMTLTTNQIPKGKDIPGDRGAHYLP